MQLSNYKKDLKKYGTILIPKSNSFIANEDFSKIEKTLNFKLEKPINLAIDEILFSLKNNFFKDPNSKIYKN